MKIKIDIYPLVSGDFEITKNIIKDIERYYGLKEGLLHEVIKQFKYDDDAVVDLTDEAVIRDIKKEVK
jgi:hypothetical protein